MTPAEPARDDLLHVPPDLAASMTAMPATTLPPPESLFQKRLRKFRRLRRGYFSFIFIAVAYIGSFFLPLIANNVALIVHYNGHYYFPLMSYQPAVALGQNAIGDPDYRQLKEQYATEGRDN